MDSITTREVREYIGHLRKQKGRRGETFSASTIRTYLNSLSQLFRRAESEGLVTPGFNPVRSLIEKPSPRRLEARRLEVHEAALFLEAARLYKPQRKGTSLPFGHALIATFLLTGGRESEVLGLEVEDVSFDRKAVTFRPNKWRRLKALTSHRTVPLWPQLEAILREYLYGGETPRVTGLLFPSPRTEKPSLIVDLRKLLDSVAESAGWKAGEIRTKMFRHTYCAARLQTLDHGAPVSVYTVARELGHGDSLVKRVYGHLGTGHRSEVVEYVADQHRQKLGDRLEDLRRIARTRRKPGGQGRPTHERGCGISPSERGAS